MLGGAESPGGVELLTVTVARDEHGYGMKVSGDNPVYVQSVKEHGAAWRAGLRAGDRILRVDNQLVAHHSHQQVVQMIRANPTTVLTVQQHTSRLKTPITAPVPANLEKQRQFEASKVKTMRLMLDKEQKYIRDLKSELLKVPDVRKSAELDSAEQRCSTLQREIDVMMGTAQLAPATPRARTKLDKPTNLQAPNTGFLSGLPRSLSNLTGQSLRNLRQARKTPDQPPLLRQNSDETNKRRQHTHNNTVPMVPTTCLDNSPPPLPPRSIERPKRNPQSPTSPLANPILKPKFYKPLPETPRMSQSMPPYDQYRRSSHSLDGELDGPQPNSIALQMSYPLVNVPPPPLQMDNRNSVPVLHVRSISSPEQLDNDLSKSFTSIPSPLSQSQSGRAESRDTPPPGTPPPPYHTNTQPCADPQRAIISMEEDDSPASDNSTYSGLFSNLRSVRESKARTAVLLNWLLGERRCACACLLLVLTDGYRSGAVPIATLRRWAYEIHSAFLMPHAVLQLAGVDENMANEIEHVLVNEYEKEELLRNVFRKARQKAKEELGSQLSEFQVKRQVGLASLYGPTDSVIDKCDVDKIQEQAVVERLMCGRLQQLSTAGPTAMGGCVGAHASQHSHNLLIAALAAAALCLQCRPAAVASAVGNQRASFLQRDKLYKQRVKQLNKQHQQPFVVRGHHLQLQALTSVAHCHHCDNVIWGLAPQAYFCTDCKLRVHRGCARGVEEACCIDPEHHNNRISRFMERIHSNQLNSQDSGDKKSRKASGAANFLNMERSFRKAEDEQPWEQTLTPALERRDESDESLYESADGQSDAISASDDALPRLGKAHAISKESLKIAVTDEEGDVKFRKTHRKAMSLSNPLEMVKNLGDEWLVHKKDLDKNSDKKKSRESLWSEDGDSINGSSNLLDQIRKNSRKEDKSQSNSRKISNTDAPKTRKTSKASSVSALNFLRRKKTPTSTKPVEVVPEDKFLTFEEILNYTTLFLDREKRFSTENTPAIKPLIETDSDEEPTPKQIEQHRRRLSRQASRSKSKARGKSQSLKVNTLRKSHSGTLKKTKKKGPKGTPSLGRSRQTSIVDTPIVKKKHSQSMKQNSWLFSSSKGEPRREGSTEEPAAPEADVDTSDAAAKDSDKDNSWRGPPTAGRGVNRAESCRERDAPRRGKHRNASDPNRLTAHNNNDLEPGSTKAPSGSSSSSSLSSRSNESNTVAAEQHASQSDVSDEDEALAAQWAESIPPHVLSSISLSARLRKRQEVIHELIVSEGSHVRWLRVLGSVFLRPLETQPALLPPDDLRSLFPNLPSVRERHCKLYAELRALRNDVDAPLVDVNAVADAMLNTLGDSGYASSLARFCQNQRMALESLRERRRKNKELHQFLAAREQLPRCGRLQLKDLLACVWQRLTKYQLLLESVLKTVESEAGEESERVRRALAVAKDVLHSVDTAIRTAENEHRLRSIKSKLEVRGGPEWEELRRLDLTAHSLTLEGELAIRNDSNKKIHVLALMLEDSLVLMQREGDKFLLKPIPQPSQQQNLSPVIKWDKVLFRPNAAVRNTFFLMNINGVQMHELSANSASEYATWVKHIQEAPLAKPELKPNITPSHQASRSTDDSGINVSRNPSDASEKSNSTGEDESERDTTRIAERERDRASAERGEERSSAEREKEDKEDKEEKEEKEDKEEKHKVRRPTVGRISTHCAEAGALEARAAALSAPPMHTAHTALSNQERLRRLDAGISRCLRAKALCVGAMLGVPPDHFAQVADLAVADALGQVDMAGEMRARGMPTEDAPDLQQILLAATTQANQLTVLVRGALSVSETTAVLARSRPGRCDACRRAREHHSSQPAAAGEEAEREGDATPSELRPGAPEPYEEGDALADLDCCRDGDEDDAIERRMSTAALGARLVEVSCGLRVTLSRALAAAQGVGGAAGAGGDARAELAALRDQNDALRARLRTYELQSAEEIPFPKADATIQDQPSNGG